MKIIGHRGASGLALENTLSSIELARLLGVDAIELDVRLTKDGIPVLCHDADISRISSYDLKVSETKLRDLQQVVLNDGQSKIPTLKRALSMVGDTPVMIELKQEGSAETVLEVLDLFPKTQASILSFKLGELSRLRKIRPDLRLYGNERTKPFDIIQFARKLQLDGIGLNFWLLNPLTYFMAKRYKLDIFVYTVNSRILSKFIGVLYPDVSVCTNHPEWFINHPWLQIRSVNKVAKPVNGRKSAKKSKVKRR